MSAEHLGPLLRLSGVSASQLPPATATPDDLVPFLVALLQEAVPFVDAVAPKTGDSSSAAAKAWKRKGSKSHADSAARVDLLERVVSVSQLQAVAATHTPAAAAAAGATAKQDKTPAARAETWVARRSVHSDAAQPGTAAWAEFVDCFRDRHAETEEAFTPTVVAAREAQRWDCGGVEVATEDSGGGTTTWSHFALRVEEMRHRVGPPLNDRVFPVLQMSCSAQGRPAGGEEFLVVSLPLVDFHTAPQAALVKESKGVVVGRYVSVERIRQMPSGGQIEWIMATASDAAGVLPMWVQTLAVPGQIAKDVPLFLGWIAKERAAKQPTAQEPTAQQPAANGS